MKFEPKELQGNVNVGTESHVKIFVGLLVALVVICISLYLFIVALTEIAITFYPEKINTVFKNYSVSFPDRHRHTAEEQKIQVILDKLTAQSGFEGRPFNVYVIDSPIKNALAFPGDRIVLTTELLKNIRYENDLAMVLAHELGHFDHYDHLRGFSRRVIFLGIMSMIGFNAGDVGNVVAASINVFDLQYSRKQEIKADLFAVKLLNRAYGHATGSTRVYELLKSDEEYKNHMYAYFATHPSSDKRQQKIRDVVDKEGYADDAHEQLIPYTFEPLPEVDEDSPSDGHEIWNVILKNNTDDE